MRLGLEPLDFIMSRHKNPQRRKRKDSVRAVLDAVRKKIMEISNCSVRAALSGMTQPCARVRDTANLLKPQQGKSCQGFHVQVKTAVDNHGEHA
jgi:hypothetical protein